MNPGGAATRLYARSYPPRESQWDPWLAAPPADALTCCKQCHRLPSKQINEGVELSCGGLSRGAVWDEETALIEACPISRFMFRCWLVSKFNQTHPISLAHDFAFNIFTCDVWPYLLSSLILLLFPLFSSPSTLSLPLFLLVSLLSLLIFLFLIQTNCQRRHKSSPKIAF